MDDKNNKIDWLSVPVIATFIIAFFGDITFFLIVTHYLCGIFVLALIGGRVKGILPKVLLGVAFILPGPFLMIGSFFAILVSNSKIAAFLVEQASIQVIAIATGGFGEVLEVGVISTEDAEAGIAVTEAGEAAIEAG